VDSSGQLDNREFGVLASSLLESSLHKEILKRRMRGETHREIAKTLGLSKSWVEEVFSKGILPVLVSLLQELGIKIPSKIRHRLARRVVVACGDLERWVSIPGYEDWYDASDIGHVRRAPEAPGPRAGKLLKPTVTKRDGQPVVELTRSKKQEQFNLGALVMLANCGFGKPNDVVVPINGKKTDCRLDNLVRITRKELTRRLREQDPKKFVPPVRRGANAEHAKLTAQKVRSIRRRLAGGELAKDLAPEYGVSKTSIYAIGHRKNWAHVA